MKVWVGVAVAAVLAACGGEGASSVDALAASGAWARSTPAGATNGVVYLEVVSPVDDEVVAASVPTSVAGAASLHHTMVMSGDDSGAGGGHQGHQSGDGSMGMEEVDGFPVAADEPLVFEPGGNHVMLDDLAAPLVAGQTFVLTLTMASGASLPVQVVVADNAPG